MTKRTKRTQLTNVNLSFYTEVNDRNDSNWSYSFDATDKKLPEVLDNIQMMLDAMGYYTKDKELKLVELFSNKNNQWYTEEYGPEPLMRWEMK